VRVNDPRGEDRRRAEPHDDARSESARDSDKDDSNLPRDRELQRIKSSYKISGEIARGGMGVILRGYDRALSRDVAVKVLREDLAEDAVVLRRFIEEAQIGGQLQHPGIVPVYEFGRMADRRPYFAMKLIRGQTLATLLGQRRDPAQDAHRFLSIFEQVCQTMAYAHSRGVIHRDLKPSNVMVGAFGEVQIVDWGVAKVLAHRADEDVTRPLERTEKRVVSQRSSEGAPSSHSLPGSIMGTPAYMPPEQARGSVAEIDERSDVFALGAILCEILSGKPPYLGEIDVIRSDAEHGRTTSAFARLDASQTDPELSLVCKRCLSLERDARPRDAGALARAIAAYLAALQERVRAAEISAAEARVQAQNERKGRRLTVALTFSIVLTVGVGAAATVWMQHQRDLRRLRAAERVNAALDRATTAYGNAKSSRDLVHWEQAVSEVDRAQALLDAGEPTEDLVSRTHDLSALVHTQAESARQTLQLDLSNGELLAKLQELHVPEGDGAYPTDWARVDAEFAQAFRDHGLDVDALSTDAAAGAMCARGIGVELASGLDDWAAARRNGGKKAAAEQLERLAVLVDPDETRLRLRAVLERGDARELDLLARTEQLSAYPAAMLNLLTNALDDAGSPIDALLVARVAQQLKPDDFVSNVYLARLIRDQPQDAARYFAAALSIRPDDLPVVNSLGWLLDHDLADHASAIALYRRAIVRHPEAVLIHLYLGHALGSSGDVDGAMAAYRETIRLDPNQRSAHAHLGVCLTRKKELDSAIGECREAIRLSPDYTLAYLRLGDALLENGNPAAAFTAYHEARRTDAQSVEAQFGEWQSLDSGGEYDRAMEIARAGARSGSYLTLRFLGAGLETNELVDVEDALRAARADAAKTPAGIGQHCILGLLLQENGAYAESFFELRIAHALSIPATSWHSVSQRWMDEARGLVEIEHVFDRQGGVDGRTYAATISPDPSGLAHSSASVDSRGSVAPFDLGRLALRRGLSVTASETFARALSSASDSNSSIPVDRRIDAVSAAVLASNGRDDEAARLDLAQRAVWCAKAAEWMRADVDSRAIEALDADPAVRDRAARALAHWRHAPRLSGVRGDGAIAQLPESERNAWRKLWTDVDVLSERIHAARPEHDK
jgi:serine/threonine-protein kinase